MYVKSDTTNAETISSQCLPGAQVILPVEQGAGSGKRRRVEESRADGGDEGDEEEENVATHIIRLFFFTGETLRSSVSLFLSSPPPVSLSVPKGLGFQRRELPPDTTKTWPSATSSSSSWRPSSPPSASPSSLPRPPSPPPAPCSTGRTTCARRPATTAPTTATTSSSTSTTPARSSPSGLWASSTRGAWARA